MRIRFAVSVLAIATFASACGNGPVGVAAIEEGPDPLQPVGNASAAAYSPTDPQSARQRTCDPIIQFISGACADGAGVPTHATLRGSCFSPNAEVGLIMAANQNGFVKGGAFCNGTVFEIGEPFVLPPTWTFANEFGNIDVVVTGQECNVEALDTSTCATSNALSLPPID